MLKQLRQLARLGLIRQLDLHFAHFINEQATNPSNTLALLTSLLSQKSGEGHICIELNNIADQVLFNTQKHDDIKTIKAPDIDTLISTLNASGVTGSPREHSPLILDHNNRLYLSRYYFFQSSLAENLLNRTHKPVSDLNIDQLKKNLEQLFPVTSNNKPDWQKIAAATAVLKRFTVISGGPGTGKTTTITKILLLLAQQQPACRIALAAPTGKAAARLNESIKQAKENIKYCDSIKKIIPEEASTIHRLLGVIPNQTEFRYHKNNQLHLDVLVVDEASMIDLPLMARLVAALPVDARLILLGDKDQLSSVEAGSVLGDICGSEPHKGYSESLCHTLSQLTAHKIPSTHPESSFGDHIALLRKSYRFNDTSGIGQLAQAINQGHTETALKILNLEKYNDIHLHESSVSQLSALAKSAAEAYSVYIQAETASEALKQFNRFRILCAQREGSSGTKAMNTQVEVALKKAGLIPAANTPSYAGRPVMITRNDYNLKLYNGDIGITQIDSYSDHQLKVFFSQPDGTIRKILPSRLPPHETVYAMTIHKSQGSEFNKVSIVLPEVDTPLLTRELIYTAITRAKKIATLYSSENLLKIAIKRTTERTSGLEDALWHALSEL
ncbi:MAG: exodeoxyribonuclease V subunit alpha [Gammaproteobacteria bacterium]|nr:exodeoxyribonuclease V subunit alpha [Gammaproteobacteria bacterium]